MVGKAAAKGLQPHIISYTIVFDACAKAGKYTVAAQWLAKAAATATIELELKNPVEL